MLVITTLPGQSQPEDFGNENFSLLDGLHGFPAWWEALPALAWHGRKAKLAARCWRKNGLRITFPRRPAWLWPQVVVSLGGRDLLSAIDLPVQTRRVFPCHHPHSSPLCVHFVGRVLFCGCHSPENSLFPSFPLTCGCRHTPREIIKSIKDMLGSYSSFSIEPGGLCLPEAPPVLPSTWFCWGLSWSLHDRPCLPLLQDYYGPVTTRGSFAVGFCASVSGIKSELHAFLNVSSQSSQKFCAY